MSSHFRHTGFTTIDLLVAVSIMAILASIAVPSYRDYTIRGKIPDATSNLASKRLQMEQYFQDNRTYLDVNPLVALGCAVDTTTSRYFDFSCTVQTATSYTIQAVGKGTMVGFTYTIDENNLKTTVAVPNGWGLPNPNNCWITKKGGIC